MARIERRSVVAGRSWTSGPGASVCAVPDLPIDRRTTPADSRGRRQERPQQLPTSDLTRLAESAARGRREAYIAMPMTVKKLHLADRWLSHMNFLNRAGLRPNYVSCVRACKHLIFEFQRAMLAAHISRAQTSERHSGLIRIRIHVRPGPCADSLTH